MTSDYVDGVLRRTSPEERAICISMNDYMAGWEDILIRSLDTKSCANTTKMPQRCSIACQTTEWGPASEPAQEPPQAKPRRTLERKPALNIGTTRPLLLYRTPIAHCVPF